MKRLAQFEGYADRFRVSEGDLLERGLSGDPDPEFTAIVAEGGDHELLGYAVVYEIAFTYDLRPVLVLKELFIATEYRGLGIGHQLMEAVVQVALHRDCSRVKWDVLPGNHAAKAFYRSLGAMPVSDWEAWSMELNAPTGAADVPGRD